MPESNVNPIVKFKRPYVWPGKSPEHWSVGILRGDSPLALKPIPGIENPIITRHDITDIKASFVADPFLFYKNDTYYLFLEIKNIATGKGDLGIATSPNGLNWHYGRIVLEEPFHLSYPYVFEQEGIVYMLPETLGANAVRLYKATRFPYEWKHDVDLLEGTHADPTVFFHGEKWWLFTCPRPYQHDSLHLYFSDALHGPWQPHPQNPVIENDATRARPAGRPVFYSGRWIRFAQDCEKHYGRQTRAFEIITLTETEYLEKEVAESPILTNSGIGWNGKGMHHIDAMQVADGSWLACVDGCFLNNKV